VANKVLISHNKNWGLDETKVLFLAQKALREAEQKETELSLLFVGRKRACDLNKKYRKMSYVPQVLSFPMKAEKDKDGRVRIGDMVICTEKLKYEKIFLKKDLYEVLESWLKHGMEGLLKA